MHIMSDPIAAILGSWSSELTVPSIVLRMMLSFVFAASIGCERSNKRHSAGLRTFILVSLSSTTATMLDLFLIQIKFALISAAVVIGIAIITTSSILYSSKSQIKGLTTAAALWSCSIIGLGLGAGFYTASLIEFVALLFAISLLPSMEKYLKDRSNHFEIHLELNQKRSLLDFITVIRRLGLIIDDIESNPAYIGSGLSVFSISLTITKAELKKYKTHAEIIQALGTLDYVSYIEEIQ